MSDKQRIARTFAAAAPDYDTYAVVQRHAAQQLALRAQAQWPQLPAAARMVEIGCGTGNLSALLLQTYPGAELLATDLAPAMVEACRQRLNADALQAAQALQPQPPLPVTPSLPRVHFAVADGEQLDAHAADLVASSLVFQWFSDPAAALQRLALQTPRLAVATLLDGTFAEWRAAHAAAGVDDGVRRFMTEEALRALCAQSGARVEVETVHEYHPDVLQFVRALKAIGAGTARPGHRPAPLQRVLRAFPHGIAVSYRVAYVLAENTSLLGRLRTLDVRK